MGNLASGSIDLKSLKVAGENATGYITDINSNQGITIKPKNASNNDYLQINSDAIEFYKGNASTMSLTSTDLRMGLENGSHVNIKSGGITIWGGSEADDNHNYGFFGSYVRIGALNQNYTKIDNEGFKIYNKGINLIFSLGNKTYSFDDTYEDTNASYQVDESHIPEEIYLHGQCANPAATGYFLVYLNGEVVPPRPKQAYPLSWTYDPYCYTMDDRGNFFIYFNGRNSDYPLSHGDELLVKAQISGDLETTSLTFGTQPVYSSNASPGFLSTNFGELNYTLGRNSLSAGYGNLTLGNAAASIGYGLTTMSNFGLIIGVNNAVPIQAFARTSDRTVSAGKLYFRRDGAGHWALIPEPSGDPYASEWYEIYDRHKNDYAFVIGNGSAGTNSYSNALTVDWDGNLTIDKNLTIPGSAYLKLDGTANLSRIRSNPYNSETHTYYITEGYHAFYTGATSTDLSEGGSDGTGTLYIQSDSIVSRVPICVNPSGTARKIITVKSKTIPQSTIGSVAAGTYKANISYSIAETGYTPIGVIGHDITGTGGSYISIYKMVISGNNITLSLRNYYSSASTPTIELKVLYVAASQGI